tara:strand:- start:291 stop:1040 length:750 start_codon:yes stop_codon:yes gene_type:complete
MKGSVDLHVKGSPGISEQRMDVLEIARSAYESEIESFVYRSDSHPTAATSSIMQQMYPELNIIGSIVLNETVGGINPSAVEASIQHDAKVVWIPPSAAKEGILSENLLKTLEVIASHEMTLISELTSPSETITLFREAKKRGVSRMVAGNVVGSLSVQDQLEISSHDAYVEYPFLSCMPTVGKISAMEMIRAIEAVGVEKCIVTTGFGQWFNPLPAEGLRMAIATLLHFGLNANQVSTLVKENPKSMLS